MNSRDSGSALGMIVNMACVVALVVYGVLFYTWFIPLYIEHSLKMQGGALDDRAISYSAVGTNAYLIKLTSDHLDVGARETVNKILELTTLERGQEIQDADVLQIMRLYNDLRAAPMPNGADWGEEFEYRYYVAEMGAYLIRVATNQFDQAARDAIFEALKSANKDIIRVPLTKPKNPEVSALIETAIFKLQNAVDLTYVRVSQR